MKKILLLILTAIIALTAYESAFAQQSLFAKKKPIPNSRGKASVRDLGTEIYNAMQTGNTERLMVFLPSEQELKDMKKNDKTTDDMKALIESVDAGQLEANFKQDLQLVQNQLTADSMSVFSTTIASVTASRAKPKTPNLVPVTITLTDAQQRPATLTFEALKIEKRVFLFRNLQVKKEELQAVNMEPALP